ncbi:MAG: tRNA (adenosine(37)-N6)-dimethylallyltransferase MiaA, partial [Acidimicrobiales bacterium]
AGFIAEVMGIADVTLSRSAAQALGYRELMAHLRGECTLDEALLRIIVRTRRFARRQERWFRRDPRVRWVDAPVVAADLVAAWDLEIESRV